MYQDLLSQCYYAQLEEKKKPKEARKSLKKSWGGRKKKGDPTTTSLSLPDKLVIRGKINGLNPTT